MQQCVNAGGYADLIFFFKSSFLTRYLLLGIEFHKKLFDCIDSQKFSS
jgi:hypothetical protein